jgi:hypothetical protein
MSSRVLNETRILQTSGRDGNAFASSPKHIGYEFMCHDQFVRPHPIAAQQEPAAEPFLHCMKPVADSRL